MAAVAGLFKVKWELQVEREELTYNSTIFIDYKNSRLRTQDIVVTNGINQYVVFFYFTCLALFAQERNAYRHVAIANTLSDLCVWAAV